MPKLTPAMFSKVGEALFGPSWRLPLAIALKNGERTVRRWQKPGAVIPDGVGSDLAVLCREHAGKLTKIADQLEGNQ